HRPVGRTPRPGCRGTRLPRRPQPHRPRPAHQPAAAHGRRPARRRSAAPPAGRGLRRHRRRRSRHLRGGRGHRPAPRPPRPRPAARTHRRFPMTATTDTAPDTDDLVPLETHCEWKGGGAPGSIVGNPRGDDYLFVLTDEHRDELDAALIEAEARTEDVLDITADHFPLPTLGPALREITDDLINGRGVVLIRGLDVERYGKE